VARNRKRRSERRPARPSGGVESPGVATARPGRGDQTPDPIEHATPDVELAEAQLALGRPELGESAGDGPVEDGAWSDGGDDDDFDSGDGGDGGSGSGRPGGELTPGGAPTPAPRAGSRLVHFLQGSWRELQRVQWPDRRQVMQATGVVIGFVIVAGVFLGVADLVATKVVNLILK
jgi:preprotein translocase subunit SecE